MLLILSNASHVEEFRDSLQFSSLTTAYFRGVLYSQYDDRSEDICAAMSLSVNVRSCHRLDEVRLFEFFKLGCD